MNSSVWAPYLIQWNEKNSKQCISLCWLKEEYEDNKVLYSSFSFTALNFLFGYF